MKYGLSNKTIEQIRATLSSFPNITKIVIYGSRAKGNYKNGSDIDLCLFGENINFPMLSLIESSLDDLFLPYSFDLCSYDQIGNQDLKEHIDRVGIVF